MKLRYITLAFLFFLTSCSFGPDYRRPEIEMPPAWRTVVKEPATPEAVSWWEHFGDPQLNNLIRIALEENKDLKMAVARVEQFYAAYGISRSDLFPDINAGGIYTRRKNSGAISPLFSDPATRNSFVVDMNLAWEIDLWGRIRRLNESALADLLSQEAARRGVIVSLIAAVAQAYVELRTLDEQLVISNDTLTNRLDSLEFARTRFQGGVVSELDVVQAEGEVETTRSTIPGIERRIAQKENQLSILLGRNPGAIERGHPIGALLSAAGIPAGISSESLLQRPDIIAAEEQLVSANALIGSRWAEYFPRLSLTGAFGYQSVESSDLFSGKSRAWNYGPSLSLPVFTAGRLGYQVDQAEYRKEEALYNYQKTIQNAFREVEDALIGYKTYAEQNEARQKLVAVYDKYLGLARRRYDEGQTSYLEVLDSQRSLFAARLELAETQGEKVNSVVELYRVFGGAWVTEAESYTPAVPKAVKAVRFR